MKCFKSILLITILSVFLTGCGNETKEFRPRATVPKINNKETIAADSNTNPIIENNNVSNNAESNSSSTNTKDDGLLNNTTANSNTSSSSKNDNNNTNKVTQSNESNNKTTSSNNITTNNSNKNTSSNNSNVTTTYTTKDKKAIQTFSNMESDVDSLLKSGSSESVKDKAKGVFISIVDFIFYNGTINGVTFNELTDAGKQKVLAIASSIDQKIEKKFPKYKETISAKTKNAFNKASELIKKGANNLNNFAKEKLGDEYYQEMIDSKDELVKYTKNAFSIVGAVGSNLFDKGKNALSNWYQNFKNAN